MQVPPPPSQPVKKSPNVLLIVLGVVGVCGCCGIALLAAVLFPVFEQAKIAAIRTRSLSHVKRIGTGMAIYCADYDDRLPLGPEWMDVLQPYVKDESVFHAPQQNTNPGNSYGYAFREELKGKDTKKIEDPGHTALSFDTTITGRSAIGGLSTLPRPGRYGGKNVIVMIDCSARAVNPADIEPMSEVK